MRDEENTNKRPRSSCADVLFEQIEDLTFFPQTDIPSGKLFRMALFEYTTCDQALKAGDEPGIRKHLEFIQDHQGCPPLMLDDEGLGVLLNTFTPKGLNEREAGQQRSGFISAWASVYLGLVREAKA